jgi:chromosome segregation ATPase
MSEIKQVWGIIKNYQCADLKMVQDPALAVFQHQQAIIDNLRSQLNNMEVCYIEKKKECEELQGQLNKHSECIENLVNQKADYLDRVTKAIAHLDSFDLSQAGMNKLQRSIESALEALRGDND